VRPAWIPEEVKRSKTKRRSSESQITNGLSAFPKNECTRTLARDVIVNCLRALYWNGSIALQLTVTARSRMTVFAAGARVVPPQTSKLFEPDGGVEARQAPTE
jgi:hypothetical protein